MASVDDQREEMDQNMYLEKHKKMQEGIDEIVKRRAISGGGIPATFELRDYFAGQALVNLARYQHPDEAARGAYKYADALLAARGK